MKVVISNKALQWVRDVVSAPQWRKTENAQDALRWQYRSSVMLFEVMPETELPSIQGKPNDEAARILVEWSKKINEFELGDRDVELVKKAIQHFVKEGSVPSDRFTFEMLKIFGLGE